MDKDQKVADAKFALRLAEDRYHAALAERYPKGSEAQFERGGYAVSCTIVDQRDDDFRVRSHSSGKVYWVAGYRMI